MTRTCRTCLETKPLNLFTLNKSCKDGHTYKCKACRNAEQIALGRNRVRSTEWSKKPENKIKMAENSARWIAKPENKIKKREAQYKKKYNIDLATYENMLEAQGGCCAICGTSKGNTHLCVDHCHSTGAVRGILCDKCNVALGQFNDSTTLLAQAIAYLTAHVL